VLIALWEHFFSIEFQSEIVVFSLDSWCMFFLKLQSRRGVQVFVTDCVRIRTLTRVYYICDCVCCFLFLTLIERGTLTESRRLLSHEDLHYEMNYGGTVISYNSAIHFMQCYCFTPKKITRKTMCYCDWNGQQRTTMGHH